MILGKKVFKHFAAIMLAGAVLGTPVISFAGADDTFQYLITTQESDEEWDGTSGTVKTTDDLEQEKKDEEAHLAEYNERKAAWDATEAAKVIAAQAEGETYIPSDFYEEYMSLYKINGVAANDSNVTVPLGATIVDEENGSSSAYILREGVTTQIDIYNITRTFYTGAPSSDSSSSSESAAINTSDSSDSSDDDNDNDENRAETTFEEKAEARARRMAFYTVNKSAEAAILAAGSGMAVNINTGNYYSFHRSVYEALAQRPDVTLIVDYKYKGKAYELTIPAGAVTTDGTVTPDTLCGDTDYAGFLYVGTFFENKER
ncbi:MAG: hypothetical protein J6O61_05260 [Butyrivibrio sp.]|uniref:hypothetical protein n=1 Tax=Butyrivibrio sp. TaxID=28121 RepID=UPI001B29AE66|nr:hypothetical protein [Butyrivibrio sp.]MBO6240234.1 hypothetical protein [Butyrivibrio sp.]